MGSLIPGFEYDIFISYRQKDNKGDRWVSEFVEVLKTELESTFKDEVSVYFDINPHDGLLETHDVDASLKEKLKCLIFVPIISRTYCDPNSFAWEHEFKVFVDQASKDQFGLKVKLLNGNIASRMLPIRIYDLSASDIKLCESVLGGVIRGVEFIYRSAGVNRPLRSKEERQQENFNNTLYRDQINKVANAIREIICCLRPDLEELIDKHPGRFFKFKEPDIYSSIDHNSSEAQPLIKAIKSSFHKSGTVIFVILIFLLSILALWGWLRPNKLDIDNKVTYSTIPVESELMDGNGLLPYFAISPDGRTVAYKVETGIKIRSLSDFSTKILEGTEGAGLLLFSPDGQNLVYNNEGQIFKINISGSPNSLLYSIGSGYGLSWGKDNYIYFAPGIGDGIWRIPANGGEPEQVTSVIDSLMENAHTWPQLLPDSRTLLYTVLGPSGGSADSKIAIQDIKTKKRIVLIDKATYGHYISAGYLIYTNNDGNIFSVPFSLAKLKISGQPNTVLSGVNTATWGGAAFISISETGNLIYLPRTQGTLNKLTVVDRAGISVNKDTIPMKTIESLGHGWSSFSLSPSGNLIACSGRSYGTSDIWIINLEAMDAERITLDVSTDETPVWSPDGNSIVFASAMTATTRRIFISRINNSNPPRLLRKWPRHIHLSSWSPDGKWIAGYDYTSKSVDCYIISADSGNYIPLANGDANEVDPRFSPDGKWIAYQSDESGRSEIYAITFPGMENKKKISINGGVCPRWDKSGKIIYYICDGYLLAHPVNLSDEFFKGIPLKLFSAKASNFEVSPDSKRFYLMEKNDKRLNPPLFLVSNWFEYLNEQDN